MLKDSLDMIEADRQMIADACESSPTDKILITHGTDTMVETAHHIANKKPLLLKQKVIVLMGAMVPHVVHDSDASFNLGFALGAVSTLNTGIYIAMSGQVFLWDKVRKNKDKMIFEAG